MPQIINYGNEMLRISAKKMIEYSKNYGSSWHTCYSDTSCGIFLDLLSYDNEAIALTSKGIYYSNWKYKGASWDKRCTSTICQEFVILVNRGTEIRAITKKGISYYSTDKGRNWSRIK